MRTLVFLELTHLLRERAVPVALMLLAAAGVYGLLHGRTVIERQRTAIGESVVRQHEQQQAVLRALPASANAGDQLFYLFFHTVHQPAPWAPLSIGQRDLHAFNLKIRVLALQGQLYDSDLGNPLLAAFGNLDLAFVFVFLAPLLVIGLSFNVWSAERELGIWDLTRSQPANPLHVLALKLAVRGGVVLGSLLGLVLMAAWTLALPLDRSFLAVVLLTTLYAGVWMGASMIVIALARSSDFNLVALLGVWIVWAVLGPALVNVVSALRDPLSEALELTVRQRQGYHSAWDRPVRETMARFYTHYPEWAAAAVPEDKYSNAWYYAMQQQGDDEAAPAAAAYRETLQRQYRWRARVLTLFPPAAFQLGLNAIARTDLDSHLEYLASVATYHEALKRFFFPVIFDNRTVGAVEWDAAPEHYYRDAHATRLLNMYSLSLAAAATLLLGIGWTALRRRVHAASRRIQR